MIKTADVSGDGMRFSVLELELGTGRMHQIRRHLSLTGNPILGDDKYGDFAANRKLRKSMNLKHLLLHASGLVISVLAAAAEGRSSPPVSGGGPDLNLKAPLPEYFGPFTEDPEIL